MMTKHEFRRVLISVRSYRTRYISPCKIKLKFLTMACSGLGSGAEKLWWYSLDFRGHAPSKQFTTVVVKRPDFVRSSILLQQSFRIGLMMNSTAANLTLSSVL